MTSPPYLKLFVTFSLKSLVQIFFLDSCQTAKLYYIMLSALKVSTQTYLYYRNVYVINEASHLIV